MRVAEFTLPRGEGDSDDAQLILRARAVETPRGPYFIRLTGRRANTVAQWDAAFNRFIGGLNVR